MTVWPHGSLPRTQGARITVITPRFSDRMLQALLVNGDLPWWIGVDIRRALGQGCQVTIVHHGMKGVHRSVHGHQMHLAVNSRIVGCFSPPSCHWISYASHSLPFCSFPCQEPSDMVVFLPDRAQVRLVWCHATYNGMEFRFHQSKLAAIHRNRSCQSCATSEDWNNRVSIKAALGLCELSCRSLAPSRSLLCIDVIHPGSCLPCLRPCISIHWLHCVRRFFVSGEGKGTSSLEYLPWSYFQVFYDHKQHFFTVKMSWEAYEGIISLHESFLDTLRCTLVHIPDHP